MAKTKEMASSSDGKIERLKSVFQDQRDEWSKKSKKLSKQMKTSENLGSLQGTLFAEIAIILDEKTSLVEGLITLNKSIRPKKKEALVNLKLNLELKMKTAGEQNVMIDADLNNYLEREDLLGMQIQFLEATLKNLNSMVWGIKNYIDLDKAGIS